MYGALVQACKHTAFHACLSVLCNYYIILACLTLHHTHYRYYTSIPLTDILLNKGTVFTGTAMKNRRDLPSPIRDTRFSLTAGETRCFRDGRLMALAWRAESKKKPLIMLSSSCSAKPVTISTRRENVSKPSIVNSYNSSMNGVDIADQLTVFYSFIRKTRKWWRKLFFYMMEVSIVNSYLLYKATVSQPRNHVGYRRAMLEQMAKLSIQQGPPRRGPGAPRRGVTYDVPQRLDRKPHFLAKAPAPRDCVVCSKRGTQRCRTTYHCNTCTNPISVLTHASNSTIHWQTTNN